MNDTPLELSNADLVAIIVSSAQTNPPKRKPWRRISTTGSQPPADYVAPTAKSMKRRCNCGSCRGCVEDARWERIFQEKFADPEYYRRPPQRRSSLSC